MSIPKRAGARTRRPESRQSACAGPTQALVLATRVQLPSIPDQDAYRDFPMTFRLLLANIAAGLIGYLRWTQMVPMLVAWTFAWGALAAFLFANFQAEGLRAVTGVLELWERHAWLPRLDGRDLRGPGDGVQVETDDVRAFALKAWGLVSLVLYLAELVLHHVRGPRKPRSWARSMRIVALLGAATFTAYIVAWLASAVTFHGSALRWVFTFAFLSLLPVLFSVYSLTMKHVLERLGERVVELGSVPSRPG
jgi:hypothetical protein